ncbi:hypothetical protein DPEC_G00155370 [Dallia pectoralis]|uniref:Uncharacterized protein n=1 Tax=Dallia pectoralis TaxID=75939 RepID=A0ACC2GK28_DALPE|nr:hypothetical protein DPEC_G00155370 [Dallia pectoralis]
MFAVIPPASRMTPDKPWVRRSCLNLTGGRGETGEMWEMWQRTGEGAARRGGVVHRRHGGPGGEKEQLCAAYGAGMAESRWVASSETPIIVMDAGLPTMYIQHPPGGLPWHRDKGYILR